MAGKQKSSNESTVTTLSIVMIVIVSAAIVMLMMREDPAQRGMAMVLERPASSSLPTQASALPVDVGSNGAASEQSAPEIASEQQQTVPAAPLSAEEKRIAEITTRFEQGVVMLHAKEFEHAATAFHRVMELSPRMPEVYVNMGYAKLGQALPREALVFFETATRLKPEQANAYWGMAVALESSGDLAGALGAMRTFLHLSPGNDNFARRARSALWEWEETLARGPLAEEEKEFLERGALQWESRNTPRDEADSGEQPLQVQPIQ